ncbi:hypothetical protein FN846DRAFT_135724 [Sphaerosporella brunnea]|uniref:Secreted protein n=1 Tax=Sphaerosporella brunnea TaxID=1250544 RepID=A0A5J5ERT8_9PEZI|nr:hypothetical protein FN846DRAFT_135724 [Sphaerosporella brunnea]
MTSRIVYRLCFLLTAQASRGRGGCAMYPLSAEPAQEYLLSSVSFRGAGIWRRNFHVCTRVLAMRRAINSEGKRRESATRRMSGD